MSDPVVVSLELRVTASGQTPPPALPVEAELSRWYDATEDTAACQVRDLVRFTLSPQGGSARLERAIVGSVVRLRFLGASGATRVQKQGLIPSTGDLVITLSDADSAALAQQPAAPTPVAEMVRRSARLLPVGSRLVPFRTSKLQVAPVTLASWRDLGLASLFQLEQPATTSVEWRGGWAEVSRIGWTSTHVGVDGAFQTLFPIRSGDAWLWWLTGPLSAVGVVIDDLSQARADVLGLLLPAFTAAPGAETPTGGCQGRSVPAEVTESELATNPDVFSEDPGSYCHPFSSPERILSERSFYTILRVEQPAISAEGSVQIQEAPLLDLELPPRRVARSVELAQPAAPAVAESPGLVAHLVRAVTGQPAAATPAATTPLRAATVAGVGLARPALPKGYRDFLERQDRGRTVLDPQHPIHWEGDVSRYQAATAARGHILELRVRWRSNGYSLGSVAKTLTLAPRQTKRIQKVEWERREQARREETTELADLVEDSLTRERSYDDAVQASLSEWAHGDSRSRTTSASGGLGFSIGPVVVGGGAAHSTSFSESNQQGARSAAASEEQQLRDGIRRFGDSLRQLRSVVVQEVTQEESVTGTTEVVRNANYAHSLSIIYYQILRHLRVDTELGGVRECLFVPFAIKPFTVPRAYRWRETLRRYLLDRRYAQALGRLKDVMTGFEGSDIPDKARNEQPIRHIYGSLFIQIGIERPADDSEGKFSPPFWFPLAPFLNLPALSIWSRLKELAEAQRDRTFQQDHAPEAAARWVNTLQLHVGSDYTMALNADFTLASRYAYNGKVRVDFAAPIPAGQEVTRNHLTALKLVAKEKLTPGSIAKLQKLTVTYQTDTFERSFTVEQGSNDLIDVVTGEPEKDVGGEEQGAALSAPVTPWEKENLRDEVEQRVYDLVDHLNEHVEHYHKAIWWGMDRDRLYMLLDGFYVPGTNGLSIASLVERDPLCVVGNSLVFRVSAGCFLGTDGVKTPKELYDLYAGQPSPSAPIYVSLPTDGLYAQSLMDSCEALERHFGNTDWVLSDQEPELGTLAPELLQSRRSETTGLTPTPLPSTIINLQNAPDAPAPTGLAGVLSAVGNANAFRDMAGLAGTQANTAAGLQAAANLAQSFGAQAASIKVADLASKMHATQTADQKLESVQRAKQAGLISNEEASQQANKILDQMHTTGSPPPDERDPMTQAIRTASQTPGSTIERETAQGKESVSLGGGTQPEVALDLVQSNSPDVRTFYASAKANPKAGQPGEITLNVAVTDPKSAVKTLDWWSADAASIRFKQPNGQFTATLRGTAAQASLQCGKPGYASVFVSAINADGERITSAFTWVGSPRFIAVYETTDSYVHPGGAGDHLFAYVLARLGLGSSDLPSIFSRAREVCDHLTRQHNVRTLWAYDSDVIPAQYCKGGWAESFLSLVQLRGIPPTEGKNQGKVFTCERTILGWSKTDKEFTPDKGDTIEIFPGGLVGAAAWPEALAVRDEYVRLQAAVVGNPSLQAQLDQVHDLWREIVSRTIGYAMAHEIYHLLIDRIPGMTSGDHTNPSLGTDLLSQFHTVEQMTGIAIDLATYPAASSVTINPITAIIEIGKTNKNAADHYHPIPPTPPFDK